MSPQAPKPANGGPISLRHSAPPFLPFLNESLCFFSALDGASLPLLPLLDEVQRGAQQAVPHAVDLGPVAGEVGPLQEQRGAAAGGALAARFARRRERAEGPVCGPRGCGLGLPGGDGGGAAVVVVPVVRRRSRCGREGGAWCGAGADGGECG